MCAIVITLDGFLKFNLFLKAPLIKNDNYIEQDWIPPRNLFFSLFLSLEKSNMSMPRTASWYLEHSKGDEDEGKPHPHYQSPFRSTLLSRNKKIKKKVLKTLVLPPLSLQFIRSHTRCSSVRVLRSRSEFWQPPLHLLSRTHISFSILTYCRSLRYIYGYSIFLSSNLFRSFVSGSSPSSLSFSLPARARVRAQRPISSLWIVSYYAIACRYNISHLAYTHPYIHTYTYTHSLSFHLSQLLSNLNM